MLLLWAYLETLRGMIEERLDEGQGLAEYALIPGLVAAAVVLALTRLGKHLGPVFWHILRALRWRR